MIRWGKPSKKRLATGAKDAKSVWTSLEIVKLGVAATTPVLIFMLSANLTQQGRDAEKSLRDETEKRAKLDALYSKRTEFWTSFRPLLADADRSIASIRPDVSRADLRKATRAADLKLNEAIDMFEVYAPYFESAEMRDLIKRYKGVLDGIVERAETEGRISPAYLDMKRRIMKVIYRSVLRSGADLIASTTGFEASRIEPTALDW